MLKGMSATLNVYDLVDHAGVRQLNAVGAGVYHAELSSSVSSHPRTLSHSVATTGYSVA